jgi:endonuclease/exonuclease/phosphatase family metal-dependent hydrolase
MLRTADGRWRTGLGAGLAALALVAIILPYQISYDLDALKTVPQFIWPTVAALLIVALARMAPESADIRPPRASRLRWAAALGPVPLLAVPAWLALTWPTVALQIDDGVSAADEASNVRVATYNLHFSISADGRLDPEQQAEVLMSGGAEVVMLQEVVRGWPIGGGLDAASWMSRRLSMDFVYGEAAESRFGNVVMANRPILDSWSATMDRGEGPMQRGYVGGTVQVGASELDVWSTHLQHRDDTTATRQAQAREVLEAWDGAERTVIAGDFNAAPGEPDLEPWFDGTGLISAEESASESLTPTAPAGDPERKIDWLLGSPDLVFSDADVPETLASDHLPVFATVEVE